MRFFHVHWYVTTRCNSRCRTCSIWNDPKYKSAESSLIERLQLLAEMKALGFRSIDFTGGEPLLYPKLPLLIRRAHQLGFFTSLTTNGTLYPKYARALKGQISSLSFSLDGPDQATHDGIRGIRCFQAVMRSILLARRLGEVVLLKTTVCKESIAGIPALIDLAAKLGVLIELNAEFSYFQNPQLQTRYIRQILRWWAHPNVIISHAHLHFMLDGGNDIRHPHCKNGSIVAVVAPNNGIFYPCMHKVEHLHPLKNGSLKQTLLDPSFLADLTYMGRFAVCDGCTIPCYMEPPYYMILDKYWLYTLWSRIGYLKKRLVLQLKIRFCS
jgi:MoaA/NifB/PqqE/SkfB family radical SAM enzyme